MIKSFKKSLFLARAARENAATRSANDAYQMLVSGRTTADHDFDELWKVSSRFRAWNYIVNKYNCDVEKLRELNRFMLAHGACVVVKGHYVPMSALAFPNTLEYLLESITDTMNDSQKDAVITDILSYFSEGRILRVA